MNTTGNWGLIAGAVLAGLAALVLVGIVVGKALRWRFNDTLNGPARAHLDCLGRTWLEAGDGRYDLEGSANPADQGLTHDQLQRLHGRLTRIPHPKDTP